MFRLRSRLLTYSELSDMVPTTEIAKIATGDGLSSGARRTAGARRNAATFAVPASRAPSLPRPARPKKIVCNMATLRNEGNTCFFNTAIQVLRATPNFTTELKSLASAIQSKIPTQQQQTNNVIAAACEEFSAIPVAWRVVLELNNVYDEMSNREMSWLTKPNGRIGPVSPSRLLDLLRTVNPLFLSSEQQDVQEFLLHIYSYLQDASSLVKKADLACQTPAVRSINAVDTLQSSMPMGERAAPDAFALQQVRDGIHCHSSSPSQAASDTVASADSPPRLCRFSDTFVSPQLLPPSLTPTITVTPAGSLPQSPAALEPVTSTDVLPQLLDISNAVASVGMPSPLPAASVAVALVDSPYLAAPDPVASTYLPRKRSFGNKGCHVRRFNYASPVEVLEGQCLHRSCNLAPIATCLSQNRGGVCSLLHRFIRSEVQSHLSDRHMHAMHTRLNPKVIGNHKGSATPLDAAVIFSGHSSEKKIILSKNYRMVVLDKGDNSMFYPVVEWTKLETRNPKGRAINDSVEVREHNSLDGGTRSRPSFRQSTITSCFPMKSSTLESTESALESCAQSSSLLHHCLSDDIRSQEQCCTDFDEPADMDVETPSSEGMSVSQVSPTLDVVDRLFKGELYVSTRCDDCESSRSHSEIFTEVGVTVSDVVRCIKCHRINMKIAEEIARSKRRRITEKSSHRAVPPPPLASLPEEQENVDHVVDNSCSGDFSCVILKAFFDVAIFRDTNKYFCETCERRTEAHRRTHYTKLPPILTIQLRCFAVVGRDAGISCHKINDHLSAPMTLPCLSCLESGSVDCADDSHSRYFLYGVVVHIGQSMNKGHYACYVKVAAKSSDLSPEADGDLGAATSEQADVPLLGNAGRSAARCSDTTWVLLDDARSVVCPRSVSSLDELLEATGNGRRATPYLLFYCRASASLCKSADGSVQPKLCSDVAHSLCAVDGRLLGSQPSEK